MVNLKVTTQKPSKGNERQYRHSIFLNFKIRSTTSEHLTCCTAQRFMRNKDIYAASVSGAAKSSNCLVIIWRETRVLVKGPFSFFFFFLTVSERTVSSLLGCHKYYLFE